MKKSNIHSVFFITLGIAILVIGVLQLGSTNEWIIFPSIMFASVAICNAFNNVNLYNKRLRYSQCLYRKESK